MRRTLLALAALCACLASALALTPGQITPLFGGGVLPAVSSNFLAGVLDPANYTYSGASLRTITDATGAITYAPNNLLTYSNDFSNAAWSASLGASVSGSVLSFGAGVGANGALTHNVNITGTTAIFAVVLSGSGTVHIDQFGGSGSNQVTLTSTPTLYCVKISNSVIGVRIISAPGDTATDVTLRNASVSAVTYETSPRPGDQVITQAAAYYGPAFDNDPVSHAPLGFRVEGGATNLFLQSGDVSNAAWMVSATTFPSTVVGTTGLNTAHQVLLGNLSTGPVVGYTQQGPFTVSSGATVTHSRVLKAGGWNYAALTIYDSSHHVGWFNLNAGTLGTMNSGVTGSITSLGGGWYKCSVTYTITGTAAYGTLFPVNADNTYSTGNGTTSYIYQDWAQLEVGSFPTSYIPTAASYVTRAADVVTPNGAVSAAIAAGRSIVEWTDEATGVTSRRDFAPGAFTFVTGKYYRKLAVYKPGVTAAYTSAHLTVGGPF